MPGDQGDTLRIEFKNNGRERYWINDNLVEEVSAIGAGKASCRTIPVTGYDVALKYSFKGKDSFADLYVDGLLYKKDVFSIQKAMSQKPSKIFLLWRILFILGIIFFFLTFIGKGVGVVG